MNDLIRSLEPATFYTPFSVWLELLEPEYELTNPPLWEDQDTTSK